jgi:hypothetical protein
VAHGVFVIAATARQLLVRVAHRRETSKER